MRYGVKVKPNDKIILIYIKDNRFNRYLYPLIYMLNENGYKCILNLDNKGIARLFRGSYQKLIFSENLLFRSTPKMKIKKKINLIPDYFYALSKEKLRNRVIPMPMHPLIYQNQIGYIKNNHTNKIVFFAGNASGEHYNKKQIFDNVIPRYEVLKYVKNFNNCIVVKSKGEEMQAYQNPNQLSYVVYEKHTNALNAKEMFNELSRSSFYLALPGVTMPLCHNIIEAMNCKSIPILQDIYANMFPVPLVNGVNCFTYNQKNDLLEISDQIISLSLDEIKHMQNNVGDYYEQYLSEKAIASLVVDTKNVDFYLQAENHSISLFSKRKDEDQSNE